MAAVPAALTPIELPTIRLRLAPETMTVTPVPPLPEIVFPLTVLLGAFVSILTPPRAFGIAAVPAAFVPILFATSWLLAVALLQPQISTPTLDEPEIRLFATLLPEESWMSMPCCIAGLAAAVPDALVPK